MLRSNAQLITAIISQVSFRDKGPLARSLIIKHNVVCLRMSWEDVEIKAEGLVFNAALRSAGYVQNFRQLMSRMTSERRSQGLYVVVVC